MKKFQSLENQGTQTSNRWKSLEPGRGKSAAIRAAAWVALVCLWAGGANAAVRYVSSFSGSDTVGGTSPTAPCQTIQRAVDSSASGDEIRIAKYDIAGFPPTTNTCTYFGTNDAVIILSSGKSLSMKGGYFYYQTGGLWVQGVAPPLVDGQNARRCLSAVAGDNDTNHVELLEFAWGAADKGANVYASGGSLQLVGTPVHNGTATNAGGGIFMAGVDFSVSLGSYSNLALPQMTGLLPIYSNSAVRGGGLFLDGGYPALTTVGVMNNTASGHGGGVHINGGMPTVVGGTIQGNTAGGHGGAIYLSNSVARVGGMIINSNRAAMGGGLYLDGPFAFTLETATLVANNYIQDNVATAGAGGAFYFNAANVGVINNVITRNSATNGAAAYFYASSPRFFQNTFADNIGSTALYVTNDSGAGRWIVTPPVVNPFPPYNVLVPGGSNFIAGIPIPSQPAFTNTIISGHATALHVDRTGNSILENKVELGFTLWWSNTVKIAGPGTVNTHNELEGDPKYTSKGTPPGDPTPYHLETNSPAIDTGTEVALTLPGTDLLLDIDAQLRPSGQGMDIGADEVVTDPFSVFFVPAAIAKTVQQPDTIVTNQHMLLNSGTQSDTYKLSVSNSLWSGSVSPSNIALASQTYTTITVIVTVPTNAVNGTTNLTLVKAISQADTNKLALALDSTGFSTNAGGPSVRYVWQASPNPSAPYTSPDTAGHDIQTVVDASVAGDTVLVYPGTYDRGGAVAPGYSLTNRVCITNAITVLGLTGPTNTYILGAPDPLLTNGPAAIRCLFMRTNANVSGFTLMDGHTMASGTDWQNVAGGGACVVGGGILSNCSIVGCSANAWGGGLYGASTSVVWDTRIRACSTPGYGGGAYLAGGVAAYNSLICENVAGADGGGIYVTSVGGAYNCTIVSNASANGGGLFANASAGIINDIIYFNSAVANANLNKGAAAVINSCTTPDPGGAGIVTTNPLFVGGGSYRLQTNSPCVDAGSTDHAPSHDFDGNHRPLDGDGTGGATHDIGCYEVYNSSGDSDGDGAKDGEEVIADTNPMNANDYLHVQTVSNTPAVKMYFTSSTNRVYSLECNANLLTNLWWVVSGQSNIPGKGTGDSLGDTNAPGTNRFYRLRVTLP